MQTKKVKYEQNYHFVHIFLNKVLTEGGGRGRMNKIFGELCLLCHDDLKACLGWT